MTKAALEAQYKLEYLIKAGLTREREGAPYDFFRGRVMFPIHNISGKVIAFGGRTLKAEKDIAKYFNSPESELYLKSNVLYGLHLAKNAIVKNDTCYLVEGYTDVVSMHQAGVENVVSSSGTSLTEGQIRLIKRYTPNITILYDGDSAGIKASFRGIDMILNGNTREATLDHYTSMRLEATLADPSPAAPEWPQHLSSSELTPHWLSPGITPTYAHGGITHGPAPAALPL